MRSFEVCACCQQIPRCFTFYLIPFLGFFSSSSFPLAQTHSDAWRAILSLALYLLLACHFNIPDL